MTHRRFLVTALALALPPSVVARPAAAQSSNRAAVVASIDSVAAHYLADGKGAGLSIAVVRGRDTLAMRGYGFADLEYDVPTPPHAIYEIGSVTKQFTAASILLLQERGKLSLDDPIQKHLPDYDTQGRTVTIRRLMDHTSGIQGYTELPEFGALMTRKLPKDSLVMLFERKPFQFEPGTAEVYNNSAYFLLGLVIEKASGESYADFVQKNLFGPVGMTDSRYCSENAIYKRRAHGYDMSPGGKLVRAGFIDHTWPYAAGSLCSSVWDLVSWNRALHGGRVLSPASYREMTTPGTLTDGTPMRYAKGLAVHEVGGHRAIEHGGGINGFLSSSNYFPDDDAVIVVLSNSTGVSADAVAESLAEVVLGKVTPKRVAFTGSLAPYAGSYAGVSRGRPMSVTVSASGDSLMVTMMGPGGNKPRAARYVGADSFAIGDGRLTFVKANGAVTRLLVDQVYGLYVLQKK